MSKNKVLELMKSKTLCLTKISDLTDEMFRLSDQREIFSEKEADLFFDIHQKRSNLFDLLDLYNNELLEFTSHVNLKEVGKQVQEQLELHKQKSKSIFDRNDSLLVRIQEIQKYLKAYTLRQLQEKEKLGRFKSKQVDASGNEVDERL